MRFYLNATGAELPNEGMRELVADAAGHRAGQRVSLVNVLAPDSAWRAEDVEIGFGATREAWPAIPDGHELLSRHTIPANPVVFKIVSQPIPPELSGDALVAAAETRAAVAKDTRIIQLIMEAHGYRIDDTRARAKFDALTAAQRTRLRSVIP